MAKAVAHCKCATCGAEFTKEATKYNRRLADEWVRWAESTFRQCPSCWGKEQREKEMQEPPTLTISLLPHNPDAPILLVWSGNTYPIKDQLKEMGYRWDVPPTPGFLGILDYKRKPNRWMMTTCIDELEERLQDAGKIEGAVLKKDYTEVDLVALRNNLLDK